MNVCIFFILVVSFTEVLSCALDNGSDDWYAKDENKKFDGSDIFGMVLFIIVAEEIFETYNIGDTSTHDL